MIDIEHRALSALEQHALTLADGAIQQRRGIADHRTNALGEGLVLVANAPHVQVRLDVQRACDGDLLLHHRIVLSAEEIAIEHVRYANAAPRSLILITR